MLKYLICEIKKKKHKKKHNKTKNKEKPAAVLIPGQQYIDGDPTKPDGDFLPLETFNMQRNQYYKFRTINVGFLAAFEISVDDVRCYTYIFSAFGEMRLPLNTIHRLMPCKYVKEYLHAGKR